MSNISSCPDENVPEGHPSCGTVKHNSDDSSGVEVDPLIVTCTNLAHM